MKQLYLFKFMPTLLAFNCIFLAVYTSERLHGEMCETSYFEMKRTAPIEGYLNHAEVRAIQIHCGELEAQPEDINVMQRCQYKLLRFYKWICGAFY